MKESMMVHGYPMLGEELLVHVKCTGDIAFERSADAHADSTTLLTWTIVEWNGVEWIRASAAGKEKLRSYIRTKFEHDGTHVDALITTLMYTLLKVQEHEDGEHGQWVIE